MENIQDSIYEKGFAVTPLDLSKDDRKNLALLGARIIHEASVDPEYASALTFNDFPDIPGKDI